MRLSTLNASSACQTVDLITLGFGELKKYTSLISKLIFLFSTVNQISVGGDSDGH